MHVCTRTHTLPSLTLVLKTEQLLLYIPPVLNAGGAASLLQSCYALYVMPFQQQQTVPPSSEIILIAGSSVG